MTIGRLTSLAACALLVPAAAPAATLVHAYAFDGSAVTDSVGSVNGTLNGNATVSGGLLHLDGSAGTFAQLAGTIIPTDGSAFSVYLKFDAADPQSNSIAELISQAYSGGGFYIGYYYGGLRITDSAPGGNSISFPFGAHDILYTTGGGNGTRLYIDNVLSFSSGSDFGVGAGGTDTRFGAQFAPYGENFKGTLDTVKVFAGIASYTEATASGAVPEPASWALMIGGFALAGAGLRRAGAVPAPLRA